MTQQRFGLEFAGRDQVLAGLLKTQPFTLRADVERSTNFETATDLFIEGDNLTTLQALASAYTGKVGVIYIDPPYNTGRDFVYRDRWALDLESHLRETGQVDETGQALVPNPSTDGRHHSRWLAMMYPRLWWARRLLRDDGLLFVSIDDHEVHRLRMVLDEIFGESCFIAQIVVVTNRGGRDYMRIALGHEYLLCYGASPDVPLRELPKEGPPPKHADARGPYELRELRNRNPKFHPDNRPNLFYPIFIDPQRRDERGCAAVWPEARPGYDVVTEPRNREGKGSVWRWSKDKLRGAVVADDPKASEVVARQRTDGGWNVYEKVRKTTRKAKGLWDEAAMRTEQGTADLRRVLGSAVFDHPKPVALVRRCLALASDRDALVLDFFAGSGTTAQAVLEQNAEDGGQRSYVLVQWPEPVAQGSPADRAGYRHVSDVTLARIAALQGGRGVRVFELSARAEPLPDLRLAAAADAPEAMLGALSRRYGSKPEPSEPAPDPWELVLRSGLVLSAERRQVGPDWTVFEDAGRTVAVCTANRLEPERWNRLALPEGAIVHAADAAVDTPTRLELAERYTLRTW